MFLLFFFKPIADMLYQFPILDYMLLGFSFLCAVLTFKRIGRAYWTDLIALLIIALLIYSLINETTGAYNFIKISSAFLLYFIGRGSIKDVTKNDRALIVAYIVVLFVNLATLVFQTGYVLWGTAKTFKGMYYYKSDLAAAMLYILAVVLFLTKMRLLPKALLVIPAVLMIILSNSRISILIALVILLLFYIYSREKNNPDHNHLFKVTPKVLIAFIGAMVISIYIVRWLGELPVFKKLNYLSFSFENLTDLANAENTQGRTVLWGHIMKQFNAAPWGNRLFGIDLVSDSWNSYESHSSYIKMLYYTGYIGLILFILFMFFALVRVNKLQRRNHYFFTLAIMLTFLIQSFSQSAIAFTQMTWILFYYIGISVTSSLKEDAEIATYDEIDIFGNAA